MRPIHLFGVTWGLMIATQAWRRRVVREAQAFSP
jgi:hypothetical protein